MTTRSDVISKWTTPYNHKYFFFFAIVFGGSFLVISVRYGTEFRVFDHEILNINPITRISHASDSHHTFTIKTEGCTISALDPFDENVKKYMKYPKNVKQCLYSNISLLQNNSTHIWTVKENLYYYNVSEIGYFNCCYKSFRRPNFIEDITKNTDNRVLYDECIYFSDFIEVRNEFVRVTCAYVDDDFYDKFFLFAPRKEFVIERYSRDNVSIPRFNATHYNVVIMGIDAVSRMNFHRTMPKTYSYLKKKDAIELRGYNKVGDNTFPNVVPLLMGINEKDLRKTCLPKPRSTFDNCPFIWDWFRDIGYYTALGEDSALLGTFNYFKVGFTSTPTDYYLYTFMHESEMYTGNNKDFNSFLCQGNEYSYRTLLDYIQSLMSTLKSDKLFGFFWEVTMSHDYLNYPMVMDVSYESFLNNIDESGYLNNTVLILMSDHGIRWGEIRNTKQGRLEERLPFVYILLPSSFRERYETAYNNLRSNAHKLTTPYDLHEVLMDLVNIENLKDDEIFTRSRTSYSKNRGISLFLPIPGNRTCEMADIDDHWCTCHKMRKLSTVRKDVYEASEHLIKHINSLVRHHPQCVKLIATEIIDATEMEIVGIEHVKHSWRELTIVVKVAPSNAVFEGTLRRDSNHVWTVSGTVSRLNLYGDQSRCVEDYRLKLYCYCK